MQFRFIGTRTCLIALLAIWLSSCATQHQSRPTPDSKLPVGADQVASTLAPETTAETNSETNAKTTQGETTRANPVVSSDTASAISSAGGKKGAMATSDKAPESTDAHKGSAARTTTNQAQALRYNADNNSIKPITRISQQGTLRHNSLSEVSGLSASLKTPGVLFAINDSGNSATVYAISEQGAHLGSWPIDAKNRDWEDMSSLWLNDRAYLVIGETGDNLKLHRHSTLYLVEEPSPGVTQEATPLPVIKLTFVFADGPRNVEAFAVAGNSIFLISKEPVTPDGPTASHLYELTIPRQFDDTQLIASRIASLPLAPANLESKLAAALAGVDLNHITSMDIDTASNTAYLLTYRHVIRIKRQDNQTWAAAFSQPGKRIFSHALEQAEALAVAVNRAVWFTSEKRPAPLWAIPVAPPL